MFRIHVLYNPRLTDAEKRLLALPSRFNRLPDLMRGPVRDALNHMIREQFRTEGLAYGGEKWHELAKSTILAKLRAGVLGRGILVFTGKMRTALLRFRSDDSRLQSFSNTLKFDFNIGAKPYPYHHLGTIHMPQRQVIPSPVPDKFRREVRDIVRDFLATGRLHG